MLERVQERANSKRYIFRTSELGNKFVGRYKQMAELFSQPPPPSIMNE
jgi:predicted transcriptional regulator